MADETPAATGGTSGKSAAAKRSPRPKRKVSTARNTGPTKMAQTNDLNSEIEALKADVARLTDRLGKVAEVGVDTANRRKNSALRSAKANGEAVYSDLLTQIEDLEGRTRKGVRDNPLQSLGIALGIGFFAALLMRR